MLPQVANHERVPDLAGELSFVPNEIRFVGDTRLLLLFPAVRLCTLRNAAASGFEASLTLLVLLLSWLSLPEPLFSGATRPGGEENFPPESSDRVEEASVFLVGKKVAVSPDTSRAYLTRRVG
jgi:hypothetical protein